MLAQRSMYALRTECREFESYCIVKNGPKRGYESQKLAKIIDFCTVMSPILIHLCVVGHKQRVIVLKN